MRSLALILAALALVGCNGGGAQNKEAVRQAVIDHLSSRSNLNISSMDVEVMSVSFKEHEADAVVSFAPKGAKAGEGMSMRYTLEDKSGKWMVKDKSDMGGRPHGAAAGNTALPPSHPPVMPESR